MKSGNKNDRESDKMSKIYSNGGEYLGSIDSLGRIRDEQGYDRGRIEKNGYIYDEHGNYIGIVQKNGHIYIDGSYIGMIDKNGNVTSDGRYMGHIDGWNNSSDRAEEKYNSNLQSVNTFSKQGTVHARNNGNRGARSSTSNPLTDSLVGGVIIFLIAIVVAIFSFLGQVITEAINIMDSAGCVMVLLLAFIGTWITDLIYNRNNTSHAMKAPFWKYMLTNYLLMAVALLIIKQGNNQEVFSTLCVTFIIAFAMTICSMLFHFTYKNEASINVKSIFILIPTVCLFVFTFYANSQGIYPYQMNSNNYYQNEGVYDRDTTDTANEDDSADYSADDEDVKDDDYDGPYCDIDTISSTSDFHKVRFQGLTVALPNFQIENQGDFSENYYCVSYDEASTSGMEISYTEKLLNDDEEASAVIQKEKENVEYVTSYHEILYKPQEGIYVYSKNDEGRIKYCLSRAYDGDGFYNQMTISYNLPDSEDEKNRIAYVIDTLYRSCGFGRDVGEPRDFDEFMKEE